MVCPSVGLLFDFFDTLCKMDADAEEYGSKKDDFLQNQATNKVKIRCLPPDLIKDSDQGVRNLFSSVGAIQSLSPLNAETLCRDVNGVQKLSPMFVATFATSAQALLAVQRFDGLRFTKKQDPIRVCQFFDRTREKEMLDRMRLKGNPAFSNAANDTKSPSPDTSSAASDAGSPSKSAEKPKPKGSTAAAKLKQLKEKQAALASRAQNGIATSSGRGAADSSNLNSGLDSAQDATSNKLSAAKPPASATTGASTMLSAENGPTKAANQSEKSKSPKDLIPPDESAVKINASSLLQPHAAGILEATKPPGIKKKKEITWLHIGKSDRRLLTGPANDAVIGVSTCAWCCQAKPAMVCECGAAAYCNLCCQYAHWATHKERCTVALPTEAAALKDPSQTEQLQPEQSVSSALKMKTSAETKAVLKANGSVALKHE